MLGGRLADELVTAKESAGLSVRELARRVGVSHATMAKLLRADPRGTTIDLLARTAEVLGLRLAASLYPNGDPVRDRAHLALIRRFRDRLAATIRVETEVPVPIVGDLRSGDLRLVGAGWDGLVEAETRLGDLQSTERKASVKQRDLGAKRLILLVSDTRHNRDVIRRHPELLERFPIGPRAALRALSRGDDTDGNAIVIV